MEPTEKREGGRERGPRPVPEEPRPPEGVRGSSGDAGSTTVPGGAALALFFSASSSTFIPSTYAHANCIVFHPRSIHGAPYDQAL